MYDDPQQALVQHMLAQHRAHDAMLCDARAAVLGCRSPDVDARPGDIAAVLRRLRIDIARHFREEDEGGCLEEATLRVPALSAEAQRIESEHAELLALLDDLVAQAEAPRWSVRALEVFEQTFEEFYQRMRAHEAAENELLRKGFGAALDAEECGETARDF
jgi:hemerythrin